MRERTKIRKYTRMEKPFSSRFRIKQYEDRETPLPDWDTVALKNLSGGVCFLTVRRTWKLILFWTWR